MNTLSFRCTAGDVFPVPVKPGAAPLRDVHVEAQLDGKPLPGGLIDVSGVIFGGSVAHSSFYFFTCSCGVPGCEGYHLPLEQRRDGDRVIWTIEDEKLARDFGASELVFDAAQFDEALAALRAELTKLEEQNCFAADMREVDIDEDGEEIHYGLRLAEQEAEILDYYRGQEAMGKLIASADPAPVSLRFSWDAPRLPGEVETFCEKSSVDIAAILLRLGESLREGEEPKAAALPEVARIVREFASSQDAAAAEAAFAPHRSFMREEYHDPEDTPVFHVDDDGPFVRHP